MMSTTVQSNMVQSASSVLVETDSPAFILRTVALLMLPFTCKVYVVAFRASIVRQSGAYEIILSQLSTLHISIMGYNTDKAL